MRYLWKCNPAAVVLTAISSVLTFGILYRLGELGLGLMLAMSPFIFGYSWFRLGQHTLLRSLLTAAEERRTP